MVVSGFPTSQQNQVIPLSLNIAFFGWFCLLFAMACSGYALDKWEGEVMAEAARWFQHFIFSGASAIALARYLSFTKRKPFEALVAALEGFHPDAVGASQAPRWVHFAKAGRYYGLFVAGLLGVFACSLPVNRRIAILAWVDGFWYLMALDWLLSQYRFRRIRAKEKVKEALDDLRSKRGPKEWVPLDLKPLIPAWSKLLALFGVMAIGAISYVRLIEEESHVIKAELKNCLDGLMDAEQFRGRLGSGEFGCSAQVLSRFDVRADGLGPNRKVWGQEKAGIDPLGDGVPGNQTWFVSSTGFLKKER
jgi:hypothetical protein